MISKAKIKGKEAIKTAKASIVLDNWDKTPGKCPIGYEHCNEIVVSRTIEQRDDQKEIVSKVSCMNSFWIKLCCILIAKILCFFKS